MSSEQYDMTANLDYESTANYDSPLTDRYTFNSYERFIEHLLDHIFYKINEFAIFERNETGRIRIQWNRFEDALDLIMESLIEDHLVQYVNVNDSGPIPFLVP